MGIDLQKLASQGRAYSIARPWTPEELQALLTLEKDCGLSRLKAADYIRNGISTVEAYRDAVAAEFKPKSLEEAHAEAENSLKTRGEEITKKVEEAHAEADTEKVDKKVARKKV